MATLSYYLVFDHVKIQAANAISSPLTYGFPAISGFVGAVHALSRNIDPEQKIYLDGVLIACHECDVQTYRPHDFADYTFKLTRNPIGKDGKTRSIIEEGKVHLDVTLIIEVKTTQPETLYHQEEQQVFIQTMRELLFKQRIAGGSVLSIGSVELYPGYEDNEDMIRRLLPAFVLISAEPELLEITQTLQQQNPTATALDALLETAKLHFEPIDNDRWQTTSVKTGHGWLVPITVGYQGISPVFAAGQVANTRNNEHETQYVECLYSLGKWVFPYRIAEQFTQAFWRYQPQQLQSNDSDVYLISQFNPEF